MSVTGPGQVLSRHRAALAATVALLLATLLTGIGLLGVSAGFLTGAALSFGVLGGFNLFLPSAGIRALTLARIVSRYGEKLVGHETTLRIARDLRVWLFGRMLSLSPGQLSRLRTGDLLARLLDDIDAVDGLLVRAIGPLLALALATLALVAFALLLDPPSGAWIAVVCGASAMIAWCRLITAARLLEDPGRTVEQVALLLDFPSGASLRNMLKRYTGLAPGEVRENGGMRCVIHAFLRSIAPAGDSRSRQPPSYIAHQ